MAGQLRLYYAVFAQVLEAVGALLERGVVHFDLKCDNCLLEPLPGGSADEGGRVEGRSKGGGGFVAWWDGRKAAMGVALHLLLIVLTNGAVRLLPSLSPQA